MIDLKTVPERKMSLLKIYPDAKYPEKVGTYNAYTFSGGGYFYDDVLEYRVWVHPKEGAGKQYFESFPTYKAAKAFGKHMQGAEKPLVLVLQKESIDEPSLGEYRHVKKPRITEWQVEWLKGNQDTTRQIPIFLRRNRGVN
jgi:hypothetical protein